MGLRNWYARLDSTDKYGALGWGIFGICIALMATVDWLLVPLGIGLGLVLVTIVVVYWVTTPPHLFHVKQRRKLGPVTDEMVGRMNRQMAEAVIDRYIRERRKAARTMAAGPLREWELPRAVPDLDRVTGAHRPETDA